MHLLKWVRMKKQFLVVPVLINYLLAGCGGTPVLNDNLPRQAPITATETAKPVTPTTTFPVGTWETVVEGVIYDLSVGPDKPISGAMVSYIVVHSYYMGLQAGRPNKTNTDTFGKFTLPVIVHDTDSIRIVIEAAGFDSYEEKLVGIDLFGGGSFDIGLTPVTLPTGSSP